MGHVGDIVPYYLRQIGDIDLFNGQTVGLSIVHAGLSLVTCLVLLALASLTIRARPERPENRFIVCAIGRRGVSSYGRMVQPLSIRREP